MILQRQIHEKAPDIKLRGSIESIIYPAWAEIKYDGEFNLLISDEKGKRLVNKGGLIRTDCSFLIDFPCGSYTLWGELVYKNGKNNDLYELLKHRYDQDVLDYKPFDITQKDDLFLFNHSFIDRLEIRSEFLPVAGRVVENEQEMRSFFEAVTSWGYEGIVVKNMDSRISPVLSWTKVKYEDRTLGAVVALGILTCDVAIDGGKVVTVVKHKNYSVGDVVEVTHNGFTESGSLRNPRFQAKED
jgi:ATP-dependent DNA ligase